MQDLYRLELPMGHLRRSRTTRRILQIASLGLAGLIAGLLSGCSRTKPELPAVRNDTDWQTSSTYASATSAIPPRDAARTARIRFCSGEPCGTHMISERAGRSQRPRM